MSAAMRLVSVTLTVFLCSLSSSAAFGHEQSRTDGNDASGKLDIARIRTSHSRRVVYVTAVMHGRWGKKVLRGGSARYVRMDLDPQGGRRNLGYYVFVKHRKGKLVGIVRRVNRDFSVRKVGSAKVVRPGNKSVKVRVARRLIKAGSSDWYRWGVQTNVGSNYDRAPDGSSVRHPL